MADCYQTAGAAYGQLVSADITSANHPYLARMNECFKMCRSLCGHTRCMELNISYRDDILGNVYAFELMKIGLKCRGLLEKYRNCLTNFS